MRAAIDARYSSENQRAESIEDLVSSCRKLAADRGYVVAEDHIYSDAAASGARKDRVGLSALVAASEAKQIDAVLVDDLSRLARDNFLMLSVLAELRFNGVRVVSVADGLDSEDEEATVGIQVRGIFNELQLRDLRKKTLRGQIGQKERGFSVGERTFGYRSLPVGSMRMDKKGRPRPDGYRMEIEPREASVVLRIFQEFGDGQSVCAIVRQLNDEGVSGCFRSGKGWFPATLSRIMRNENYVGRWIWSRRETRRDPKTGRRKQFPKPESEWIIREDEALRIVPQALWVRVQERHQETTRTWPGGKAKGGAGLPRGGWIKHYPDYLLSGAMACGVCGGTIAQVSGKGGGYYGCLAASRGACDNRLLVRRILTERVVMAAVRNHLASAENLRYVLRRVEEEVAKIYADVPGTILLKETELKSEERKLANFIEFIGEGRGTRALAAALEATERRVEVLRCEVEGLSRSREAVFRAPPLEWIRERAAKLQDVLERQTGRSALILRRLLGPIRLEPTRPDIGHPYYRALTSLQALALIDESPEVDGSDPGSTLVRWWRRRELNPRPKTRLREALQA